MIHKAAACLLRTGPRGPQLLVVRHPVAGVQIPKGSVEPGERSEDAVLRELAEESGIAGARILRSSGRHEIEVRASSTETGPLELQVWHTFLLAAEEELPETWSRRVSGSEAEAGLVFEYFWLPVAEARWYPCLGAMHRLISSPGPCYRAPMLLASTTSAAVAAHGSEAWLMLRTSEKGWSDRLRQSGGFLRYTLAG